MTKKLSVSKNSCARRTTLTAQKVGRVPDTVKKTVGLIASVCARSKRKRAHTNVGTATHRTRKIHVSGIKDKLRTKECCAAVFAYLQRASARTAPQRKPHGNFHSLGCFCAALVLVLTRKKIIS